MTKEYEDLTPHEMGVATLKKLDGIEESLTALMISVMEMMDQDAVDRHG